MKLKVILIELNLYIFAVAQIKNDQPFFDDLKREKVTCLNILKTSWFEGTVKFNGFFKCFYLILCYGVGGEYYLSLN